MQSPVNVLLPTVKEHAAVANGTQSDHFNDKTTAYGASECQETVSNAGLCLIRYTTFYIQRKLASPCWETDLTLNGKKLE